MKKIMMVAAIALATLVSNAATVNWKTGISVKAPTSSTDGTFGTANAASGTLSMYVWLVNAATYDSVNLSSVYDNYYKAGTTASGYVTGKGGASGATAATEVAFSSESETTYYGIILTTYKSGDTEMYIANKATATVDTLGNTVTVGNLAKYIGGASSGTAITGWTTTANVPEPTSGLLLLLGMAGLALKRKIA